MPEALQQVQEPPHPGMFILQLSDLTPEPRAQPKIGDDINGWNKVSGQIIPQLPLRNVASHYKNSCVMNFLHQLIPSFAGEPSSAASIRKGANCVRTAHCLKNVVLEEFCSTLPLITLAVPKNIGEHSFVVSRLPNLVESRCLACIIVVASRSPTSGKLQCRRASRTRQPRSCLCGLRPQ